MALLSRLLSPIDSAAAIQQQRWRQSAANATRLGRIDAKQSARLNINDPKSTLFDHIDRTAISSRRIAYAAASVTLLA